MLTSRSKARSISGAPYCLPPWRSKREGERWIWRQRGGGTKISSPNNLVACLGEKLLPLITTFLPYITQATLRV